MPLRPWKSERDLHSLHLVPDVWRGAHPLELVSECVRMIERHRCLRGVQQGESVPELPGRSAPGRLRDAAGRSSFTLRSRLVAVQPLLIRWGRIPV